jgi:hypothetical protein
MITHPTVLILGAGASIGYGFPSGLQLKAQILQAITRKQGDEIYLDLLKSTSRNGEYLQDFYDNLLLSSEMSIDAFLEHNQQYSEVGRRAIANILLRKEKHDELFDKWIDKWLDPNNKDKHWYQLLFSKLNAPFKDFEKNQLKIITFNYDRSLEYFLLESMKAKYSEEHKETVLEKLHAIPILHIYGKLGNLPEYDSSGDQVPYDLFKNGKIMLSEYWWGDYVCKASRNIITIHQAKEINAVIKEACSFLIQAQRIYFLGFGYDKINMERLFVHDGANILQTSDLGRKCFGTSLDLSPHHKKTLFKFGLANFSDEIFDEKRGIHKSFYYFHDGTIYDFLYYNPFSELD